MTDHEAGQGWTEDKIVDHIQSLSTIRPTIDIYRQVEWVQDDVAIGLALDVYNDLRKQLAENTDLKRQLAWLDEIGTEAGTLWTDDRISSQIEGLTREPRKPIDVVLSMAIVMRQMRDDYEALVDALRRDQVRG